MAEATRLTTDNLPPQQAALAWRDWMATLFDGLESDLYGDTGLTATCTPPGRGMWC